MTKVEVHSRNSEAESWTIDTSEIVRCFVVPRLRQTLMDAVEAVPSEHHDEAASWLLTELVIFLTQDRDIYARWGSLEALWRIDQLTA